jgi:hypothetical protein
MRDASGRNEARLRITGRFVAWLEECRPLQSENVRQMLAERLARRFGGSLPRRAQPTVHMELVELVEVCADLTNGLSCLVRDVHFFDPLASDVGDMAHLADEWFALMVVFGPEKEQKPTDLCWADLRDVVEPLRLTAGPALEWRLVCSLVRKATEFRVTAPPEHCDTVWTAFTYLVGANAFGGHTPPAMVFLDCVADKMTNDEARAKAIRDWVRSWARDCGLEEKLDEAAWRQPLSAQDQRAPAYLVIQIERNLMATDEIVLSHWKQCDQPVWRPERGLDLVVSEAGLEPAVDGVVSEMEAMLGVRPGAAPAAELIVEFVLPLEFLNSPVEHWRRRSPLGGPDEPMALDHAILLRSLDRHRHARFHWAWRQRWEVLKSRPGSVTAYWSKPNGKVDYFVQLATELTLDERIVSLVLSEPLRVGNDHAVQEWSVALKHGVPAIMWHREDCTDERCHRMVTELCADGELASLPQRVAALRRAALRRSTMPPPDQSPPAHIAVLWDDPERLPDSPGTRGIA